MNLKNTQIKKREKIGPVSQKILLLLGSGFLLFLNRNPNQYFKIIKGMTKEWKNINKRSLHISIKKLYQSKLVDLRENKDGTIKLILSDAGKTKVLVYNIDKIKIKQPKKWDGLWRVVIFDIPEHLKKGRDILAARLKRLGFQPIQKSVFVYPYECKNEVDFITEIYNLRPYVRFLVVKETDVDLDLKNRFGILK